MRAPNDETVAMLAASRRESSEAKLRQMQESGNPLYAWEMLISIGARANDRNDPHAETPVPNWVLAYLAPVAEALTKMGDGNALTAVPPRWTIPAAGLETITPAEALAEAPRVLGLVRKGWNAFAAYRRDQLRETAYLKDKAGLNTEQLCRYLGVNDKRSLQRELVKYRRKYLSHMGF